MVTHNETDHTTVFISKLTHGIFSKSSWIWPRNTSLQTSVSKWCLNRGTNTGGGAAYVYWLSPNVPDTSGIYYTGSVPWAQLTNVIWVETVIK